MNFDIDNVKTTVNINYGDIEIGAFGYFANDIDSLYRAVIREQINLKAVYTRLSYCLEDKYERRFGTPSGNFSLFYPIDNKLNETRY